MTDLPIGFASAANDWNEDFAGRPYSLADWNQLTFGEQQRYGASECKTKGAVYGTKVLGREVSVVVNLPDSLVGSGFSESEARWLEQSLHKAAENTIHWILTRRSITKAAGEEG